MNDKELEKTFEEIQETNRTIVQYLKELHDLLHQSNFESDSGEDWMKCPRCDGEFQEVEHVGGHRHCPICDARLR